MEDGACAPILTGRARGFPGISGCVEQRPLVGLVEQVPALCPLGPPMRNVCRSGGALLVRRVTPGRGWDEWKPEAGGREDCPVLSCTRAHAYTMELGASLAARPAPAPVRQVEGRRRRRRRRRRRWWSSSRAERASLLLVPDAMDGSSPGPTTLPFPLCSVDGLGTHSHTLSHTLALPWLICPRGSAGRGTIMSMRGKLR